MRGRSHGEPLVRWRPNLTRARTGRNVSTGRVVWRVLRAEGWRAVVGRTLDRFDERVAVVRPGPDGVTGPAAPVLNLLATPPARRLGGLSTQLLARLGEESRARPVALLHPHARSHRLVHWRNGERSAVAIEAGDFASAVPAALRLSRARGLHLEGIGGLPPSALRALAALPVPLVVSIHDFAGWCATAHLLETPVARFCGFSADAERCARCLATAGLADDLRERRAAAARLLGAAVATIHPSRYLLDRHRALFPEPRAGLERVIEPASLASAPARAAPARPGEPPVVAYVGNVSPLKGGHLVEPMARALRRRVPAPRLHVLGGGDAELLLALRRVPGVAIHGYYRAGTLPARLAALGAAVAVAPSIVPEAFHLTLSECWLAGVPCVTFEHGASAERIRAHGGGRLVPLESGARGLADAVTQVLDDPAAHDVGRAAASVPIPTAVAAAHLDLYAELGLVAPAAPPDTIASKRAEP